MSFVYNLSAIMVAIDIFNGFAVIMVSHWNVLIHLLFVPDVLTDTVDEYLGVPYARSPEGQLRFKVRL